MGNEFIAGLSPAVKFTKAERNYRRGAATGSAPLPRIRATHRACHAPLGLSAPEPFR
jgi:hypothetical protein